MPKKNNTLSNFDELASKIRDLSENIDPRGIINDFDKLLKTDFLTDILQDKALISEIMTLYKNCINETKSSSHSIIRNKFTIYGNGADETKNSIYENNLKRTAQTIESIIELKYKQDLTAEQQKMLVGYIDNLITALIGKAITEYFRKHLKEKVCNAVQELLTEAQLSITENGFLDNADILDPDRILTKDISREAMEESPPSPKIIDDKILATSRKTITERLRTSKGKKVKSKNEKLWEEVHYLALIPLHDKLLKRYKKLKSKYLKVYGKIEYYSWKKNLSTSRASSGNKLDSETSIPIYLNAELSDKDLYDILEGELEDNPSLLTCKCLKKLCNYPYGADKLLDEIQKIKRQAKSKL
ncbi:MAG: hypothetical protein A2287_05220 [Candidatus Melainabacteria bacterium RIFOXYA12_FULL_32_12]|nr:MAG: hypothetical protein A2287_05220 [Candidatus Melainabacteria bacterium RIFOXYA12_FULL_32_12]